MRLFESIIEANHRAVEGDTSAGLHPDDFAEELPIIALTCIDPRLNAIFPNALGIPADQFIWLRNAGNIIFEPLSNMMRSLALACAVKGGKEIAIIGHTDCQVARTTALQLLDKLKALGVVRSRLPENLNEFFGLFSTEAQNVIKGCEIARQSPLISPNIPVHGLLVDTDTGKLDWIVNGYEKLQTQLKTRPQPAAENFPPLSTLKSLGNFNIGEMKFPETKIGEWVSAKTGELETAAQHAIQDLPPIMASVESAAQQIGDFAKAHLPEAPPPIAPPAPPVPPKLPLPPPIRPRITVKR